MLSVASRSVLTSDSYDAKDSSSMSLKLMKTGPDRNKEKFNSFHYMLCIEKEHIIALIPHLNYIPNSYEIMHRWRMDEEVETESGTNERNHEHYHLKNRKQKSYGVKLS